MTRYNKFREEINEMETKKMLQRIKKSKGYFFEMINQSNRPFSQLTKRKKERGDTNEQDQK